MFIRPSFLRLFSLLCLLSIAGIGTARAQFSGNNGYGPVVSGKGTIRQDAPKLPPALPGTTLNRDRSTPADRTQNADLPPTDALFDAINRGDILSARDALNRGADLNGRNVLGLTPIDESVDLSRNDITFLLLSMRGAQPASPPDTGAPAGKTPGKSTNTTSGKAVAAKAPIAPQPRPVMQATAGQSPSSRPVTDAAYNRPAMGAGGNPVPQSGFLGFGG